MIIERLICRLSIFILCLNYCDFGFLLRKQSRLITPNSQESQQSAFAAADLENLSNIILPRRSDIDGWDHAFHSEKNIEPPPLTEIARNLTFFLHSLHHRLQALASTSIDSTIVWETYLDVTRNSLIAWDDANRHRFPKPRNDGTIFVSIGSYRDPFCPMTLKSLYKQAKHPEKLFIGLLQQNCFEKVCATGVLKGGFIEETVTDMDCYEDFCSSSEGIESNACNNNQVRLFNVNETESLGPYMARYFGGKFYRGEQFYMQIDSHSEFVEEWDEKLIEMYNECPAHNPVLSTYPPDAASKNWQNSPGSRICNSEFAKAQIEWQIIRLGGSPAPDKVPDIPAYAPFVAAGFIFTSGSILHDVPFDPLLPWIFMGEEISMSSRLWTAGYDMFFPKFNVLNHWYVRRHYPKFWESVNRFFISPIHNDLVELVIKRVKHMLDYPESKSDMVQPISLLYRIEDWSMGNKRSLKDYKEMVGIETITKTITRNEWCFEGKWPKQAVPFRIDKVN